MLLWGLFSVFFGGLLGGFYRLRNTAKMLFLSWQPLISLALKKRELLHKIIVQYVLSLPQMEEEISFLKQISKYSLREFLRTSHEDCFTLSEMERVFTLQLKQTLESLQELTLPENMKELMEELLAYENAFSFGAYAFEKAAETYKTLHDQPIIRLAGKLFGFPKVPLLSFS